MMCLRTRENEVTSMCEAMNQAEKRGLIKGTVATLLRLGMENNQILEEVHKNK